MNKIVFAFAISSFLASSPIIAASTNGYVVNDIAQDSTMENLGLQRGDRILAYDDKKMTSLNDTMDFYEKLNKNAVKRVVIERNGQKKILNYKIR